MNYFSRHLKPGVKPGLAISAMIMLLPWLTSCRTIDQNTTLKADMDGYQWICEAFRPITYTHEDNDTTVVQIVEHNASWEVLCLQNE